LTCIKSAVVPGSLDDDQSESSLTSVQ